MFVFYIKNNLVNGSAVAYSDVENATKSISEQYEEIIKIYKIVNDCQSKLTVLTNRLATIERGSGDIDENDYVNIPDRPKTPFTSRGGTPVQFPNPPFI